MVKNGAKCNFMLGAELVRKHVHMLRNSS